MSKSQLSPLQERILAAFFRREQRFFLTGGAALAGYHLGHRRTADLDLFTTHLDAGEAPSALDVGDATLRAVAEEIGATVENISTSPEFRRRQVKLGADRVIVDLAPNAPAASRAFPRRFRLERRFARISGHGASGHGHGHGHGPDPAVAVAVAVADPPVFRMEKVGSEL